MGELAATHRHQPGRVGRSSVYSSLSPSAIVDCVRCVTMRAQLDTASQKLSTLKKDYDSRLQNQDTTIAAQVTTIAALNTRIANQDTTIAAQDTRIANQEIRFNEMTRVVNDLRTARFGDRNSESPNLFTSSLQ